MRQVPRSISIAIITLLTMIVVDGESARAQRAPAAESSTGRAPDMAAARRRLPLYMTAVAATLDQRLQDAIAKIRAGERRYLAIRGYVRREYKVNTHWSWTAREAREFRKTAEYREMV